MVTSNVLSFCKSSITSEYVTTEAKDMIGVKTIENKDTIISSIDIVAFFIVLTVLFSKIQQVGLRLLPHLFFLIYSLSLG